MYADIFKSSETFLHSQSKKAPLCIKKTGQEKLLPIQPSPAGGRKELRGREGWNSSFTNENAYRKVVQKSKP